MSNEDQTTAAGATDRGNGIDAKLLEFLVCPKTKGALVLDAARNELVCRAARLAYPIRDGVPIMLPDEARSLDDDDPHLRRS
jgi:hypothetical protein